MSYTSGLSTSVETSETLNDESSSSSMTVETTLEISSPDESDGSYATVGGEAIALGEDTLTSGTISGEIVDDGAVTSTDLSATMIAVGETDGDETAFTSADTFATVSDGNELVFAYNQETESSTQDATGSTSVSTSTTEISAYDINLSDIDQSTTSESGTAEPDNTSTDGFDDIEIDGNIATLELEAVAVGEDTLVSGDAFVLAVEDELSITSAFVELAVD